MPIRWVRESEHASASELYDDVPEPQQYMAWVTLRIFERLRADLGNRPIRITSGRRTEAKQLELREKGYKAASISTHCYGVALDLALPLQFKRVGGDVEFANTIKSAAISEGFRVPRLGVAAYRDASGIASIVHFDCAWLLGFKGMPKEWRKTGVLW